MDNHQSPPKETSPPVIFCPRLRVLRRRRAIARMQAKGELSFLLKRCAADAAERILDINRRFENMLVIGFPAFAKALEADLPPHKTPAKITNLLDINQLDMTRLAQNNTKKLGKFDLIITAPGLHSENDLPGVLLRLRALMQPDGVLLAALFGEETLSGLRRAAYGADEAYLGGATARIAPMISYSQLAMLMSRAGFAMPVIDRDRVSVSYQNLSTLIEDLRDLGETNILSAQSRRWPGRDFAARLEVNFPKGDAANSNQRDTSGYREHFDILWATGWAPHPAQPKPLKPGSAKTSLAGALREIRRKKP